MLSNENPSLCIFMIRPHISARDHRGIMLVRVVGNVERVGKFTLYFIECIRCIYYPKQNRKSITMLCAARIRAQRLLESTHSCAPGVLDGSWLFVFFLHVYILAYKNRCKFMCILYHPKLTKLVRNFAT